MTNKSVECVLEVTQSINCPMGLTTSVYLKTPEGEFSYSHKTCFSNFIFKKDSTEGKHIPWPSTHIQRVQKIFITPWVMIFKVICVYMRVGNIRHC